MGFDGFLSFGGIELINAQRTLTYVKSFLPRFPLAIIDTELYGGIADVLDQAPYVSPLVDDADWLETDNGIDPRNPSHAFYGMLPLSIEGIGDSTMEADGTESIRSGGTVNSERDAMRGIRVRGMLVAADQLSLEAGLTWMRNALRTNACAMHGDQCGYSDLRYFLSPPGNIDPSCPPEDQVPYALESYDRTYHRVSCTRGVEIIRSFEVGGGAAYEVDFILTAATPHAFSTQSVDIELDDGMTPILVADQTTNLFKNPAATTAVTPFADAANYCMNPTAELGTTHYTAIPGTTGVAAVTNPTSPTSYGTKVARVTWSVASTAAGGGLQVLARRDTVPAAPAYPYFNPLFEEWNIFVGHVKSNKAQRVRLEFRYYDAADVLLGSASGGDTVLAAGVAVSVTGGFSYALASTPIAAIRVTLVTIAGTGYSNWAINDYLEMDGVSVMRNRTAFYFDGATVTDGSFTYSWAGTAGQSGSYRLVTPLKRFSSGVTNALNLFKTSALSHSGASCMRVESVIGAPYAGYAMELTGPAVADWLDVIPSAGYTASIWIMNNELPLNYALYTSRLGVGFYDAANNLIGSIQYEADPGLQSYVTPGWHRKSVTTTLSPAGAVKARVFLKLPTTGSVPDFVTIGWIDDFLFTFGGLTDWFNGSTTDTNVYEYAWTGTEQDSTSVRTLTPNVVPTSEIIDPDLPPIPEPPSPPTIEDIALTDQTEWLRYSLEIPAEDVAVWATTVVTATLTTRTEDIRQVRVRFYANPFDREIEDIDLADYCGEFLISYLPANTELVVSGVTESAWAQVAGGGPIAANQLLYGTGGIPMEYPELSCGYGHYMTVDIPPTAAIENLEVAVAVNRRE